MDVIGAFPDEIDIRDGDVIRCSRGVVAFTAGGLPDAIAFFDDVEGVAADVTGGGAVRANPVGSCTVCTGSEPAMSPATSSIEGGGGRPR